MATKTVRDTTGRGGLSTDHDLYKIPSAFTKILSGLTQLTAYFIEAILFLGFILKLFGANPSTAFVRWAYRSLDRVMAPFDGVFGMIDIGQTSNKVSAVFDPSILFAMVIYGIVLVAIHSALEWIILHLHRSQVEHLRAERQAAYDEVANSYSSYRPDVMGAAISTHDQQGAQG